MNDFTAEKIKKYQSIIDNSLDGEYELKELFNPIWKSITPTTFGKEFKEKCKKGIFSNITYLASKTDNHSIYTITKKTI